MWININILSSKEHNHLILFNLFFPVKMVLQVPAVPTKSPNLEIKRIFYNPALLQNNNRFDSKPCMVHCYLESIIDNPLWFSNHKLSQNNITNPISPKIKVLSHKLIESSPPAEPEPPWEQEKCRSFSGVSLSNDQAHK